MATTRASRTRLLMAGAALLLAAGCGYPAVQPVNLEIITSLRTACSVKDPKWLDDNEKKIEEQRAAGQMDDTEYETFLGIIEQARGGDWEGAERACLKFQKAQGPTPEQMEKMRAFHEK